jgi:hypothetical protein
LKNEGRRRRREGGKASFRYLGVRSDAFTKTMQSKPGAEARRGGKGGERGMDGFVGRIEEGEGGRRLMWVAATVRGGLIIQRAAGRW